MKQYRIRPTYSCSFLSYTLEKRRCFIFWEYITSDSSKEVIQNIAAKLQEPTEYL